MPAAAGAVAAAAVADQMLGPKEDGHLAIVLVLPWWVLSYFIIVLWVGTLKILGDKLWKCTYLYYEKLHNQYLTFAC